MEFYTHRPLAGDHIDIAIRELIKRAPARMEFNGAIVEAYPGDTEEGVLSRWWSAMDANAKAYRESPEGVAAEAERQRVKEEHQKNVTRLIQELEDAGWWSTEQTLRWVASFADAADHIDLEWNREAVAERLERWGWRCNDALGHDPQEYKEDLELRARWIMGQVISGIRGPVGSPHPICGECAREWLQQDQEALCPKI